MKTIQVPVLVVGAGSVGLAVGLDLGWRGIGCLVIDQEADRESAINLHPRAAAVTPRSMEFCRRWGVGEAVEDSGFPKDFTPNIVYCTDMQGPTILVQPFSAMQDRKPTPASPELRHRCPQIWFDPILERGLAQYPCVQMKRPWQLDSFEDRGDKVVARICDLSTREQIEVACDYMVACDGPTSKVRESLGVPTTGSGILSYSINAILDIPNFLSHHDKGAAERYMFIDPRGVWSELTVMDGRDRWRLGYAGNAEQLDRAAVDMPAVARRVLGPDTPFTIIALAPWRRRESIAQRLRVGRVFLAGDAAHTIPPNLGMGMNTGLGDAVDIGWKLEAALKGWAGQQLLDSYDSERRPAASHIAAVSTETYRRWMTSTPDYHDIENPGELGDKARARAAEYIDRMLPDGWDTLGLQIGYRYDDSPICIPDGSEAPPPGKRLRDFTPTARPGAHAPHAWLRDGRSMLDLFGRGFVLLRFDPSIDASAFGAAAAQSKMPFKLVDIDQPDIAALYQRKLVLVRPDAHVAWRADAMPVDAADVIDTARGAGSDAAHVAESIVRRLTMTDTDN